MKACPRHDEYQDHCFACRIRTVYISAHATPTRRPDTVRTDTTEGRWGRDIPAYRRLRRQGLQPRGIDGCAELEQRANNQMEVEYGHLLTPAQIKDAQVGLDAAADIREEIADAS